MDLDEIEEGVKPLSNEDKANLGAVAAEKARLGIVDDEPGSGEPGEGKEEGIVLGPEDDKTPEAKPEKKAEPKAEPAKPAEPPADAKDKKEPETPERPVKYIPIPKYQKEKDEWQTSLSEKDQKILELSEALEQAKKDGGKDESAARIAELSEQTGIEPEALTKLVDLARQGFVPAPAAEPSKKDVPATPPVNDPFPAEWDSAALPDLKAKYPTATPEQLADAKELIEAAAHSEELRRYPMDYVLWHEGEALKTILSNPKRKSVEPGARGRADYVPPADQGKPDLENLTPARLKEIEKQRAEAAEAEQSGVRVMRDGREVIV